jgi:hypothetical protein
MKMNNVLLVTDYSGNLHITPVGNASFYKAQNQLIKDKQYKLKEMKEDEAMEFVKNNKGRDPEFISTADSASIVAEKNAKIEELQKQLEAGNSNDELDALKKQNEELQKQLEAALKAKSK